MTKNIFWLLFFIANFLFSQESEHYIYASVPSQFSFQKEKNQYRINTTLKAYFQQKGFTAYLDDEILNDAFSESNCNKIYIDLEVKNTMFNTILFVIVKDCKNTILLKSEEGSSRNKDSKTAYNESLLMALKSIKNLQFKKLEKEINKTKSTNNVESLKSIEVQEKAAIVPAKMFSKQTNSFVMLQKTSQPSLFIANSEKNNGIVTLINNKFIFEYYSNGILTIEQLEIRQE